MPHPFFCLCRRFLAIMGLCVVGPLPPLLAQSSTGTQNDTATVFKGLPLAAAGFGLGYTAGLVVLSKTWYSQSEKTGVHFFNDNRQWKQVDKVGHFWGAFHEGRLGIAALRAARVPEKKAILYGGLLGFVLQSPIEILDGYAQGYGASAGDLGANALGAFALITQELSWGAVRLQPKFSFHQTRWAALRPGVLGAGLPEEMLKDYNGQTYWLAADVAAFLPPQSRYPRWLHLALGYGADGMVHGSPTDNRQAGYQAYRQYYLALDVDFSFFKPRSKLLKGVFWVLDMVHLPGPAVEYNRRQGLKLHPIYF
jgi:VanZ family protein